MNFDHIRKLSTAIGQQLNAEVSFDPERAASTLYVRIKPRAFERTTVIVFHEDVTDEIVTSQLEMARDSLVRDVFSGQISFTRGFPL